MTLQRNTDKVTYLNDEDMQAFCDAANNPKPPTDKLKEMMRNYSAKVRNGQIIIDEDSL